jgi:hypothetical protein
LGQRLPTISGASAGASAGRMRPISGGQRGFLAMETVVPWLVGGGQEREAAQAPPLPDTFYVENLAWSENMEPISIEFSEAEVADFLHAVWRRQTSENTNERRYPFSRRYFQSQHKPRLDTSQYHGLMRLALDCGLIANRTQGKSGKLLLQPARAMRQVKFSYGLK